ncbi:MAG: 30S ribosomal protein S20 [Armatimonadota bacterium]
MANIKSSKKDIVRSRRRRVRNSSWTSSAKTVVRKARTAIASRDATVATELTREASRHLDKAAAKGVIHPRQAARRKSRLAKRLAKLSPASQG